MLFLTLYDAKRKSQKTASISLMGIRFVLERLIEILLRHLIQTLINWGWSTLKPLN
jgi:hypothetical protein